ncbi:hypothetical protein GO685_01635 [Wolbachia endosymbiont of Madathamugadia hiepei]|uniref:hypothetical protein n=1 Tax=Wolbachia endosymbiont of Madathamugadia hiepei TaxID=1241303 RepID=UPI00158D5557|nr:hypothetical protein [Wolbachia endosymbiont of Madathamugadia hiepei]NUX01221.1 hypothetical protein [Wolbachia endosymbiont of Madathamugadia hiepei]
MPNDEKNQNTPSIWACENAAHITKIGIEGTVTVASLTAAITTILVATGAIAGPAFLASVANPVGIAALFVAAVYFTAAAYSSYQQMHKNEEISAVAKDDMVGKSEVVSTFLDKLKNNPEQIKSLQGILGGTPQQSILGARG